MLLSQLYLRAHDFRGAREAARAGLYRLLRMGFAWDFRQPWSGWIAAARLTHCRASRMLRGEDHLPYDTRGMIHLPDLSGSEKTA